MQDLIANTALRQILEERARVLAQPPTVITEHAGEELVIFRLGTAGYGMAARWIREIQPLPTITTLPAIPAFVLGLVNIRGRLLTVLDLRPLMGLAAEPPALNAQLLVINIQGIELGLLTDTVLRVAHLESELTPALSSTIERGTAWIRGVDRHLNLILDPVGLIADPRLLVNTNAA